MSGSLVQSKEQPTHEKKSEITYTQMYYLFIVFMFKVSNLFFLGDSFGHGTQRPANISSRIKSRRVVHNPGQGLECTRVFAHIRLSPYSQIQFTTN